MRWSPACNYAGRLLWALSLSLLDHHNLSSSTIWKWVSLHNGIILWLLSWALTYRQNGDSLTHYLGRKAKVVSLLHHLSLNGESLRNAGPIISSLMGGLCDNTQLPQKTERGLNNMLVRDLANTWCNTGYSGIITFWDSQNSPEMPSRFKDK